MSTRTVSRICLVGVALLVACIVIVRRIRTGLREDDLRSRSAWVRIGAVASLAAIGLQELVEFSLQIPANTVLFAVVLGSALHKAPRQRSSVAIRSDTQLVDQPNIGVRVRMPKSIFKR